LGQRIDLIGQKRLEVLEADARSAVFAKRMSEQRSYEFPKLDCLFCSGAVPVIAIPLTLRRTVSRPVKATNGPAVQSLTWAPLPTVIFLVLQKQKPIHRLDSEIFRNGNAHLCRHGQNQHAGNGSIDGTPHPTTTFY
jgi:hypothetical protein